MSDSHLEAEYEEKMGMSAQQAEVDDYDDPNYETCSLCTTPVPQAELTTMDCGEVCPECIEENDWGMDSHGDPLA